MITVHLHGRLKDLVDDYLQPLRFDVYTPAEVYLALRSQVPGFATAIREGDWQYLINDDEPVTQETAAILLPPDTSLHIYPVAAGSGPIIDFFVGVFSFIGSLFFPSIKDYNRDSPDERASYLFDGAVNTRAQGGVVPLVFGGPIDVGSYTISAGVSSARLTPPRTHLPTHLKKSPAEFENTLQTGATIRIVDLISEGEIEGLVDGAQSVFLDGVPIQDSTGQENIVRGTPATPVWRGGLYGGFVQPEAVPSNQNLKGVKVDSRNGTADQTPLDGIPAIEAERVVNQQVTQSTSQVQAINAADTDVVRVTMRFPRLSFTNEDGDTVATAVRFAIDVQSAGEAYETKLNQTIHDKNISPAEISYDIPLTGDAPWNVRVRRLTADSGSDRTQNQTWWARMTEIKEVKQTYPHSAVVSIVAEAEQFTGNLQRRKYRIKGIICDVPTNYDPIARTYTGIWDGTFKRAWTDNGAWIFYYILINRRFGLGADIEDEYLSAAKWALYTISQFNDGMVNYSMASGPADFDQDQFEFVQAATEPRFRFTGVISKPVDAKKLLDNMLSNFHAAMYYGGGAVVPVQDAPADAEALLTNSNVIDGDFTYADLPFSDRVSVVNVSFNDPDDGYKLAIEQVIDNDLIAKYGYKKRDVVAMFCTSRGQAHRFGRLLLFEQENESDVMTTRPGLDQIELRPGAVVRQSDALVAAVRTGCRLSAYTAGAANDTLVLDDMSSLPDAPAAGWIANVVLSDGSVVRVDISDYRQDSDTIVLDAHLAVEPVPGAVCVIERAQVEARQWRTLMIKENDDMEYAIETRAYFPDKYVSVETGVNVVTPNYRLTEDLSIPLPAPTTVTLMDFPYLDGLVVRSRLAITVEGSEAPPITFVEYQVKGPFVAGGAAAAIYEPAGQSMTRNNDILRVVRGGDYQARARFVSGSQRVVSAWVESAVLTVTAELVKPIILRSLAYSDPQGLNEALGDGSYRFTNAARTAAYSAPSTIFEQAARLALSNTDQDGTDLVDYLGMVQAGDMVLLERIDIWWMAWRVDSVSNNASSYEFALTLRGGFGDIGATDSLEGIDLIVGFDRAAPGRDGVAGDPGLPGASYLVEYNDVKSGNLITGGQYKFSDSDAYTTSGMSLWASVKDSQYAYVHKSDAGGNDNTELYDQVSYGDQLVYLIDDEQWAHWRINSADKSGDVYRFAITLVQSVDKTTDRIDDGTITFRFSRAPKGRDGQGYEDIWASTVQEVAPDDPDNAWNYGEPVDPWKRRIADTGYGGSRPYLYNARRPTAGNPAVGDAVAADWESVYLSQSLVSAVTVSQPGPATNTIVSPGNQYLLLTWRAPDELYRNTTLPINSEGWRIRYRVQGETDWIIFRDGSGFGSPEIIPNLTNGTTYEVEIVAYYSHDNSPDTILESAAIVATGTPIAGDSEVLAQFTITAGLEIVSTTASVAGYASHLNNEPFFKDVTDADDSSSDLGSFSTIQSHPIIPFSPLVIGIAWFDISTPFGYLEFDLSSSSDDAENNFESFVTLDVGGTNFLRTDASWDDDTRTWSWDVDSRFLQNGQSYVIRLLRTPAPNISAVQNATFQNGDGRIITQFDAPVNAEEAAWSRYRIRHRTSINAEWVTATDDLTDTFYIVTGLTNSTAYEIEITGYGVNGYGQAVTESVTPNPVVLGRYRFIPASVTYFQGGSTNIASIGYDNHGTITGGTLSTIGLLDDIAGISMQIPDHLQDDHSSRSNGNNENLRFLYVVDENEGTASQRNFIITLSPIFRTGRSYAVSYNLLDLNGVYKVRLFNDTEDREKLLADSTYRTRTLSAGGGQVRTERDEWIWDNDEFDLVSGREYVLEFIR